VAKEEFPLSSFPFARPWRRKFNEIEGRQRKKRRLFSQCKSSIGRDLTLARAREHASALEVPLPTQKRTSSSYEQTAEKRGLLRVAHLETKVAETASFRLLSPLHFVSQRSFFENAFAGCDFLPAERPFFVPWRGMVSCQPTCLLADCPCACVCVCVGLKLILPVPLPLAGLGLTRLDSSSARNDNDICSPINSAGGVSAEKTRFCSISAVMGTEMLRL